MLLTSKLMGIDAAPIIGNF